MTVDERIAELAAAAPPLSPEQRARLAGLFRSADLSANETRKAS